MCKSDSVIKELVNLERIPELGEFTVTEDLIDTYQIVYKSLFEKTSTELKSGNKNYARKLAGIFLMKENQKRLASVAEVKIVKSKYKENCGIVYVVSNHAFPNCYKVGMTKNLDARLKSYQTYDPNRSFKVEHYRFVKDAKRTEKDVLTEFKFSLIKGEWIKGEEVLKHFVNKLENM